MLKFIVSIKNCKLYCKYLCTCMLKMKKESLRKPFFIQYSHNVKNRFNNGSTRKSGKFRGIRKEMKRL